MRGRQEGTRRRARAGSPERRSRTDGEVEDAWMAYRERAQQRSELPGPFGVSSVRQEPVSPSQLERGVTTGGPSPGGTGVPVGGFVGRSSLDGADVPIFTPLRPRPGEPGSVGTFSSETATEQPQKRTNFGEAAPDGPSNEPGTASGPQQGVANLEQQLTAIVQAMTALQSQFSEQHAVLERRLVAVEDGRSRGSGLDGGSRFGTQYRGSGQSGSSDFNRVGSPIRTRTEEHQPRRTRESSGDRDVFSKSEKWLPQPPEPKVSTWVNREAEIEGFFSYIQALRAWSQLASDKMATEIQQAIRWRSEIATSTLTVGQQGRSARLFALLKVAFSAHPRIDSLIRAYEAGCAIHNSPSKPYGSCGYELLRILALEFSLRTRTEAICLRAELLKKEFRVDAKSLHVVSDLVRVIQVAVSKFERLIETLPPEVEGSDLKVGPSDLALLFIRNLPHEAKQYVLLHSESESWDSLQSAALKYERQQRLYVELGAFSKRLANEVAVTETNEDETFGFSEDVSAVQTGCSRCGKRNHDSSTCKTDLTKTSCFKCGLKGHIGRNCKTQGKGNKGQKGGNDGKGSQADPKSKAKATPKGKGKGKSGKGSGGKGKGKMYEVGDEQSWEETGEQGEYTEEPDGETGGESLAMPLLGGCLSEPCECEFDLVLEESMMSGSMSPLSLSFGLMCPVADDGCRDVSWYDGLVCRPLPCEPLLSSSVSFASDDHGWWLVDSGASVTVLCQDALNFFEVLDEEEVPKGPRFYAANGSQVTMNKKVTVRAFIEMETKQGGQVISEIKLSALVGETKNNILSTTQLVNKGWHLELNKVSKLVHNESGSFAVLTTWSGCPWVRLRKTRDEDISELRIVSKTGETKTLAVLKETEVDEMHRARGHIPYDPHCAICQRTRGVSQHRRKREGGGSIIELSADYFFLRGSKFLLICEQFSRMIGCVYMDPSTDVVRASVKKWLLEMGCLGNEGILNVFTDDEVAVGAVFFHLGVGKDVKVSKAPPQSQAMNGLAERSVRAIKESFLCVSEELRQKGLEICESGKSVAVALEYVCFMMNMHASVHGSSKTPQEFLSSKKMSAPTTSAFGAVVLCELPASLQSEARPRFLEGAYLRPEFNSLGCVCRILVDGVVKEVRPKSIKLVLPLRWEPVLLVDLVKPIESPGPGVLRDSEPGEAVGESVCDGPVRLSLEPPTERAVCPKSGPPLSWFKEYGLFTEWCAACRAIKSGLGRQGKSHSASCCANYVRWLKGQREVMSEKSMSAGAGSDPVGLAGHDDEERIGGGEPPDWWFDANGGYTSECPACSALELGQSTSGLRHSDGCRARFSRWLREYRSRRVSEPPLPSAGGFFVPEEVPESFEYTPSLPPEDGQDMDLDDSFGVSSKGVKRAAETTLEPETVEMEGPEGSRGSRKRQLETEDMDMVSVADDGCQVFSLNGLDRVWSSPDVVFDVAGRTDSVVFRGSSGFEDVTLDGKVLRVWKPDHGIDDTTSEILDGDLTFRGMLTEVANMNRVDAGTPLKPSEAERLAKQHGIRIIQCRWVSNAKTIEGQPGVRARIVVKDIAANDAKAKELGISSPTPSSEAIKTALAVAGFSDAYVTTLDCSAAFMHTPLDESKRKIIVKLPLSVSWGDDSGSPVYLLLKKSLNGIRSASLDWLQFAQSIVKGPMNLVSSPTDPCVFTAPGIIMVIYVDDIIIISKDRETGSKVQALFNKHVPTKLTGVLEPSKDGQLKFVGRVIRRVEGSNKLLVNVLPGYLDSCFEDYGLSKLKTGKAAVPNLRETLDAEPNKPLSAESYAKFRRCLGKLAWMSQTREDLHVFISLLATGQHAPDERYEKGIKQLLRFLLLDGEFELSFPGADLERVGKEKLITVFCDASHAPMRLTQRKGISGAFIFVLNSLIKGFSRHQSCVSLSSCESELFSIQESVQEAVGLLPMVRKLVFEFFGGFEGFEGKSFPIHLLTDSESGRQLLEGLDIPRKSRHTEVRIYWVRDQMSRWVTISWIAGELNVSDILTKCSSYHFTHREAIGFTKVGPAQLATVSAVEGLAKTGKKALILIELCCQENSALKRKNSAFAYFGISSKAEEQLTVDNLCDLVQRASAAARREGMSVHVHTHVSCPCTSGSPIRFLSGMNDEGDIRFGELEPILGKLKQYRQLSTSMSLEWPLHNALWGFVGIKELLVDLGLTKEAVVRLCRMGVASEGNPQVLVGKRLRFVSDSEAFCRPLRKYQACECAEHATFGQVDWSSTAFYNDKLARVLNGACRAAMDAR